MSEIHPTAQIHENARIGKNAKIGPFCVIEDQVELGDDCVLKAHNFIEGPTRIGSGNQFGAFCHIGHQPYHLLTGPRDNEARVTIGDNNTFGSYVSVSRGMMQFSGLTSIGDNCSLFDRCVVSHDCKIGDHVVASSTVMFAGHVIADSYSNFGAVTGMLQHSRVGYGAMVTSYCGVPADILPFAQISLYTTEDRRQEPRLRGVNIIGLKRRGVTSTRLREIIAFYNELRQLDIKIGGVRARIDMLRQKTSESTNNSPEMQIIYDFANDKSRKHSLVDFPHDRPKMRKSAGKLTASTW